jgi:hypothetical protein
MRLPFNSRPICCVEQSGRASEANRFFEMRLVVSAFLRGVIAEFQRARAATTSLHHHLSCGAVARDRGRRFRLTQSAKCLKRFHLQKKVSPANFQPPTST